jgi:hypothetical protein
MLPPVYQNHPAALLPGTFRPPNGCSMAADKRTMPLGRSCRLLGVGALAISVALALAAAALADREQIKRTATGDREARTAVLTKADFGAATGWSGGAQAPHLSSTMPCSSFQPKQSDLVVVGAAEAKWQNQAIEVDSEAQVLQSPHMVSLDWQRTIVAPQVMPCLREGLVKSVGKMDKLESFTVTAFPKVGNNSRRLRAIIDVKNVRVMMDIVVVAQHATEITLTFTAPAVAEAPVSAAELVLARRLAARATG